MAVRHLLTQGIGFGGGSVNFIVTLGLAVGEAIARSFRMMLGVGR